jgi:hypothetical protein
MAAVDKAKKPAPELVLLQEWLDLQSLIEKQIFAAILVRRGVWGPRSLKIADNKVMAAASRLAEAFTAVQES